MTVIYSAYLLIGVSTLARLNYLLETTSPHYMEQFLGIIGAAVCWPITWVMAWRARGVI